MKIRYAARVEKGVRESNDDRILAGGVILDDVSAIGTSAAPAAMIVCDGCGGYDGGGLAAETVLKILSSYSPEQLENTALLAQVLEEAREAVYRKKEEFPVFAQMCTTVAGCIFGEEKIHIFHAGDSRVYRYDRWGLGSLTMDHSYVQDLVKQGILSEEEAAASPERNIITRCIGIECPPPEIYVSNIPIGKNEIFLLCSDGLWDVLSAEEIESILEREGSLEEKTNRLTDAALENGSDDNISVCLCAVCPEETE